MMFSFIGIDHKSFAKQRTKDAEGHDFSIEERRVIPRSLVPLHLATEEEILDRAYRTLEAANLSKLRGGHYLCAYRSAGTFLELIMDRGYKNPRGKMGRVPLAQVFRGTSLE
jgi:hypothetical protein